MGRGPASGDEDSSHARSRRRVALDAAHAGVDWLTLSLACVDGRVDPLRLHHVREITPFADWVEMQIANEALGAMRKIAEAEARQGGDL